MRRMLDKKEINKLIPEIPELPKGYFISSEETKHVYIISEPEDWEQCFNVDFPTDTECQVTLKDGIDNCFISIQCGPQEDYIDTYINIYCDKTKNVQLNVTYEENLSFNILYPDFWDIPNSYASVWYQEWHNVDWDDNLWPDVLYMDTEGTTGALKIHNGFVKLLHTLTF